MRKSLWIILCVLVVAIAAPNAHAAPLALACSASTGIVGVPYSSALVASGGTPPYGPYAITSGSISPLELNTATGAITGTPTTAGTLTFMASVQDSVGATGTTGVTACTITISGAPPSLALACSASAGLVGVPYSSSLVASGGTPPYGPYAITSGSISPLVLNTTTGAITGTPTTDGTLTFMASVMDSATPPAAGTTGATACTITISNCPAAEGFWHKARNWPIVTAAVTIDGVTYNPNQSIVIGGHTYTQAQLLLLMASGGLHTGGYVNGLTQFIAAVLNLVAGAQHTATIDSVISSINTALTGQPPFMIMNSLNPGFPASLRALLENDASELDAYNSATGLCSSE